MSPHTAPVVIGPYPIDSLPAYSRGQALATRRAAHALPALDLTRALDALEGLIGARPEVVAHPAELTSEETLVADGAVGVALMLGAGASARALVVMDGPFAAHLVTGALGGGSEDTGAPLTETEQGVLAYMAARLLASQSAPGEARVAGLLTRTTSVRGALGKGPVLTWPLTVRLDAVSSTITVRIPLDALPAQPAATPRPAARALPVTLSARVGAAELPRDEVGSLRTGDVVLLDRASVEVGEGGAVRGEVALSAAGGRRTTWRCALSSGRMTVRTIERTADSPSVGGRRLMEDDRTKDVIGDVGDAPVELTVEIARFHMPLCDVTTLRVGEVVSTGKPLDTRVTLRAGDRAVAHGELVTIDGEVGVRLLAIP